MFAIEKFAQDELSSPQLQMHFRGHAGFEFTAGGGQAQLDREDGRLVEPRPITHLPFIVQRKSGCNPV